MAFRFGAASVLLVALLTAAARTGAAPAAATPAAAAPAAALPPRPLLVTVDDLPIAAPGKHQDTAERERLTRELLAVLAKHRIHAVGLVTWANALRPSDTTLLERWLAAGHELGNHTDQHLDYTATDSTTYIADVERGRAKLADLLAKHGQTVRFFRFPYLREGDTLEKLQAMRAYLARTGQRNMPVTIDDEDWSYEDGWIQARLHHDRAALDSIAGEYQMALRLEVRDHEARGDDLFGRQTPQILLLHANEVGTAQWDPLFTWLEHTGHRFANADEVLADSAFAVPHTYVGRYGCSLWHRIQSQRRQDRARAALAQLLDDSAAAWNRGDLTAFVSDYAEDALFISPNGVTRGRQAVLERYQKRYPDRRAMGTLSFEIVEVRLTSGMEGSVLGSARPANIQGASVVARWTLTYPEKQSVPAPGAPTRTGGGSASAGSPSDPGAAAPPKTATGLTLLVLRPRGGGKWEILQDASM